MEENRAEQLLFLWEKISEGEIRLLRVFGEQPVVTVPGFIDGRCVRELGDYCFSRRKLPENEIRYSRYCGGMWESGLSVLKDKEKKQLFCPVLFHHFFLSFMSNILYILLDHSILAVLQAPVTAH